MSKDLGPARALAASARLANLPSVVCNIWLGVGSALAVGAAIVWSETVLLLAAGVSLYFAGNFLNDWHDRAWDAEHRPERALPRGLFAPLLYLLLAVSAAAVGMACATFVHPLSGVLALAISACVLVYTIYHKRVLWALLPLAGCRAMLPVMAFVACGSAPQAWLIAAAAALFCHTLGISLTARQEGRGHGVPRSAWLCFAAAALLMFGASQLIGRCAPGTCLAALLPYALWTTLSLISWRMVRSPVAGLLAGFPLLDWILLLPLVPGLLPGGPAGFISLCLPPVAWLAGLALQRLAPAT